MSRLRLLFSKTPLGHLWREFAVRWRFKFVLPRVTQTTLDGIRLDLSTLSLRARNRLLMGIYESNEKHLVQELLCPEDSVLEIGGAIGFIGLFCQKRIGIQQYFAFEANPETLGILRRNYELNTLTPAAWNLALARCDGPLDLEVASDFWDNSTVPSQSTGGRTIKVQGACLKTILSRVNRQVNVLIIDVEGAEQFIDLDHIPAWVNKLIIELHPHILGPEKTSDLMGGLIARGFYVARQEENSFGFLRRQSAIPELPSLERAVPKDEPALAEHGP